MTQNKTQESCGKVFCVTREAFKIFDRDGDGFIDMKEFRQVRRMIGSLLVHCNALIILIAILIIS